MLDLSYDSYKSSNKPIKKKNDLSYSSYSAGKQKLEAVNTEKTTLRSQGEPVSLKDNRATPTMGGKILRGAANLIANPVTNIVNAGQIALGKKETKPFSGDYLGKVDGLGKVDITKSPLDKENLKTIKKSVGTGLELASYLTYGGVAKTAVKTAVTKTTELAAKQTFKEYALTNLPKLLKEGALTGASYTGGSQLNENAKSGKKFSWEQAAKDVTLSTVLTPVAAIGIRKLFGKKTSAILDARAKVRADADAAILNRPIPDVGTPSPKFMQKSNRMLPAPRTPNEIPIELPEPGMLKSQQTVREFTTPPSTPQAPVKTPKTPKVKPTVVSDVAQSTSTPIPSSIPKEAIPEFKAKVDYGAKVLDDVNPESANKGNHKLYSETVYGDIAKDPERVKRIAMGSGEATTNGVPADAYYAIMKNEAAKSGNVKLIKELSNSNVGTISGKKLEANKLTQEGDIVDTVRDIYKARAKAVGVSEEALKRNEKTLVEKLKSEVKVMLDKIPTKQEMNDIINSLVCK